VGSQTDVGREKMYHSLLDNQMKLLVHKTYQEKLLELLSGDLNFHDKNNKYTLHSFHPFPAKFPPQLPNKFITALTAPNERVLDPMMGVPELQFWKPVCAAGRESVVTLTRWQY